MSQMSTASGHLQSLADLRCHHQLIIYCSQEISKYHLEAGMGKAEFTSAVRRLGLHDQAFLECLLRPCWRITGRSHWLSSVLQRRLRHQLREFIHNIYIYYYIIIIIYFNVFKYSLPAFEFKISSTLILWTVILMELVFSICHFHSIDTFMIQTQ